MSNATLTNIKGEQAQKPDLTITLNRTDLDNVMMGVNTFEDLISPAKRSLTVTASPTNSSGAS